MKLLQTAFLGLLLVAPFAAFSAEEPTPEPTPAPRLSVFSTSTDWEAVTGMRLGQYRVKFISDKSLVKNGLELYFLDGFPCYGQPARTQIWLGANGKSDREMLITCLYPPKTINLAWRNASRDATQGKTTGMFVCPVSGTHDLSVDLSKCTRDKDWKDR